MTVIPRSAPVAAGVLALLLLPLAAPDGGESAPSTRSVLGVVSGLEAQATDQPVDSAALVREVRERQAEFEHFRQSRIPVRTRTQRARCDERIGRICHWFGGAEEADFPPEPPETGMARSELLQELSHVWSRVRDPWVLGQLVYYLEEQGQASRAEARARECGLTERWWCDALLGYVLHLKGDLIGAEEAFRSALTGLPPEEEERWLTPRYVLSPGAREDFAAADPEERERLWERLWRFSDPLFMVDGNDRLTDHYARIVLTRIREDAAHPFQLQWEDDLEEALIRYGREIGWSRMRQAPAMGPGVRQGLQDDRRVVGHHHPGSRGYLFPEEFLEAPEEIPPEAWITAPREARTWYAAPYAPDFRGLETQVARFRRGDSLLVVGAFRPDDRSRLAAAPRDRAAPERDNPFAGENPFAPPPDERADDPFADPADDPFADPGEEEAGDGPVQTGLFLMPVEGGELHAVRSEGTEGVLTLRAPAGRYVSSLEVLNEGAGSAWRARQGVTQAELPLGLAALSDVLLLREGADLPDDLEEAIPLTRPGIRIQQGERFILAWEVYGMGMDEPGRITIGFTEGRPGFLRRVGEFLGIMEPDEPVEITFEERGPEVIETVFRAIRLQLPDLEPGEYTIHVQLDLPGREPAVASRPIVVEAAGGR